LTFEVNKRGYGTSRVKAPQVRLREPQRKRFRDLATTPENVPSRSLPSLTSRSLKPGLRCTISAPLNFESICVCVDMNEKQTSSDSNKELLNQSLYSQLSTARMVRGDVQFEHASQTKTRISQTIYSYNLSWNETHDPRTTSKIVIEIPGLRSSDQGLLVVPRSRLKTKGD